jgi:hypothetical protein
MTGSVSFQPAGTKDWVDATPNRPLTTGDSLWADQDSRGEMHIDGTALHLSSQTGITFLNLNDQIAQIQLAQGSLEMRVRSLPDNTAYEIDTPNLAFAVLRPGEFRINVDPNGGSTSVDVLSGSGEATAAGQAYPLNPGQEYSFAGTDQIAFNQQPLPARDDFANWCASRDQHEDNSASARYISRDVPGYNDLDDYGRWSQDPTYGAVWVPTGVDPDWAPYHYGHWVFVAPWGWTWVEDEPWGFAPFHYGRWAIIGGAWGWVPGPVAVGVVVGGAAFRPVYAPALVGFVGGGGLSVSVAFGGVAGVGWFPLGPRDVWVPPYRYSPAYVTRVNVYNTRIVNVTQVTNVYTNYQRTNVVVNNYTYANNTRAVTAVSRETFVNGQAAGRSSIRVTSDQIGHPQVVRTNAPIAPTHQSFVGPGNVSHRMPPAVLANRQVVTRATPAPNAVAFGHSAPLVRESGFRPSGQPNGQPNNNVRRGGPNGGAQPGANNAPNSGFRGNANGNTNLNNGPSGSSSRPNNTNNPVGANSPDNNRGFRPFTPPTHGNAANGSTNNPSNDQSAPNRNSGNSGSRPNNGVQPFSRPNNASESNGNPPVNNSNNPNSRPSSQPPANQTQNPNVNRPVNRDDTNSTRSGVNSGNGANSGNGNRGSDQGGLHPNNNPPPQHEEKPKAAPKPQNEKHDKDKDK